MGKEEFALPKFFSLDDKMLFANSKYILYKKYNLGVSMFRNRTKLDIFPVNT